MIYMENPFPYTLDNKRYHTFNYYLKSRYDTKVAKVILDGHFTCPNRDGSKGYCGCIYCSAKGSGDANASIREDVLTQYADNKQVMDRKWPNGLYIPYFQSFSNTYGPLDRIREMLEPFMDMDEVCEISLATRCDCLEEETVKYLDSLCQRKPVWLELGLQTSNDRTGQFLNRCYSFDDFTEALERLAATRIRVCVHVINGLPYESREDMLKTVADISHLEFSAIKIHMLHILKDTALSRLYEKDPFPLLTRDEYIETVVRQLELQRPEVIIERLTGDPLKDELIGPQWLLNKTTILNDIDKLMVRENTWQGKRYAD